MHITLVDQMVELKSGIERKHLNMSENDNSILKLGQPVVSGRRYSMKELCPIFLSAVQN